MDLSSLTGMFVGLHATLAFYTKTPELEMSPDEGAQFMGAVQNVLRNYPVQTTQKTLDWIALFGTAGGIYGTRFAAVMFRRREEQAQARRHANGFASRQAPVQAPQPAAREPLHFEIMPDEH